MASSSNKVVGWDLKGFSIKKEDPAEKFYLAKHSPDDETISFGDFQELAILESGDNIALVFGFPSDRTDLPLKMDCTVSRFLVFLIHSKPFKFYKDEVNPSKGELALHAYFKGLVGNYYINGKIRYSTDMDMWNSPLEPWGIQLGSKVDSDILSDDFQAIVNDIKAKTGSSSSAGRGQGKSLSEKYEERVRVAGRLAWLIMYPDMVLDANAPLERVAVQTIGEMSKEQMAIFDRLMPSS